MKNRFAARRATDIEVGSLVLFELLDEEPHYGIRCKSTSGVMADLSSDPCCTRRTDLDDFEDLSCLDFGRNFVVDPACGPKNTQFGTSSTTWRPGDLILRGDDLCVAVRVGGQSGPAPHTVSLHTGEFVNGTAGQPNVLFRIWRLGVPNTLHDRIDWVLVRSTPNSPMQALTASESNHQW